MDNYRTWILLYIIPTTYIMPVTKVIVEFWKHGSNAGLPSTLQTQVIRPGLKSVPSTFFFPWTSRGKGHGKYE